MSSLTESLKDLWDAWHIRGLIILSLLVQSFLILFAPLRKQRRRKWHVVRIGIWLAYLFADWVAIFTIGLILRAESSDILTLWAPFLLLHLGGPDTITSFSLEDNELWIRHLLGLLLQVGSTVYIILLSLSNNKLWLPTLLVLTAGIIKYAERNRAFYLASFDQFGNNWEEANKHMPPVPALFSKLVGSTPQSSEENLSTVKKTAKVVGSWASWLQGQLNYLHLRVLGILPNQGMQLNEKSSLEKPKRIEVAVYLLGVIKSLLVGPPLSSFEKLPHPNEKHDEMLQAIEISLNLLYELLHTKLPVVHSQIGYVYRIVNLGCILGALVSFSLLKTHHYESFDIWLTYGLLIGALALDLISIMLLISSDWITMAHFQKKWNSDKFINKPRWSNSVPQLNIFNICDLLNKEGSLANKDLFDILGLRSLLKKIRRAQWVTFKQFVKDQEWQFIFTTLTTLQQKKDREDLKLIKQLVRGFLNELFKDLGTRYEVICSSLEEFGHMESLLMWHIVTEYYYQEEVQDRRSISASPSTSNNIIDHRSVCKLLSDYMFYLLVMEPSMITVSPNSCKLAFEGPDCITLDWLKSLKSTDSPSLDMMGFVKKSIRENIEGIRKNIGGIFGNDEESREKGIPEVKMTACKLVNDLKENHHRWEIMANIWVWILLYAAISCQPSVHARQVSKGGQLLTLVWLLMNYMGFIDHSHWFPLHAIRP